MTSKEIIKKLKNYANPKNVAGMAKFGIQGGIILGVNVPVLRKIAKETGKDHKLAQELWNSKIHEARILASMIDDPKLVTSKQMDLWVAEFDSWDVCDQVCMNLFDKTAFAWDKVFDWAKRDKEFEKRAAFTLIACLAWHNKAAVDEKFIRYLPLINKHSTDERNFVKKAVNWALRHIGKRNKNLNLIALKTAREIEKIDSRSARWIAHDAIRELETKFK